MAKIEVLDLLQELSDQECKAVFGGAGKWGCAIGGVLGGIAGAVGGAAAGAPTIVGTIPGAIAGGATGAGGGCVIGADIEGIWTS